MHGSRPRGGGGGGGGRGGGGGHGGGGGAPGPPISSFPNPVPQNRCALPQFPSFSFSSPWQGANSNFQNPSFQPSQSPKTERHVTQSPHLTVETVEAAVAKAHKDLLDAGENVSVWKLSQSVARYLKVCSWDALGFRTIDVPTLREIQSVEGKVNAFIHCFVNTRKITSVHEMELDICKNEGVDKFEDLGLGPLLRHPLVQHYFSVSPDAKEVCVITTEDLVGLLSTFLYRKNKKEVTVEEFLDFLVKKLSVPSREHLGVRIRNMGLFIKYIKAGRREESIILKSIREGILSRERQEMLSQSIPSHLGLSPLIDDASVDNCKESDTFEDVKYNDISINGEDKKKAPSGLNNVPHINDANSSGKNINIYTKMDDGKLISGNKGKSRSEGTDEVKKFNLTNKEIERFVTTWKDACNLYSVNEVLSLMIDNYSPALTDKRKRKTQNQFSSYPTVGLLNVAVRFMRDEMLVQMFDKHAPVGRHSTQSTETFNHEPVTEGKLASDDENHSITIEKNIIISVDDIIKKIVKFVEPDPLLSRRGIPLQTQLVLRACEMWLRVEFSVKEFKCLNHGSFFEFLEKHAFLLPDDKKYLLAGEVCTKSIFEVTMLQKQLFVLLSQAVGNVDGDIIIKPDDISFLLRKQFPLITLKIEIEDHQNLSKIIDCQEKTDVSSAIFSATLLGNFCRRSLLSQRETFEESSDMVSERDGHFGSLGFVSAKDAIECLLKAPMFSDLQSWSHWDLLYAPSLGPILEWLLNLGTIEELSCIVTSDGRIIRIDHSATPDEFLEASIQGSSFQAALKLLSLLQLHGGSHKAPVSLLKCYFQQAIDVITKNCTNHEEADVNSSQIIPVDKTCFPLHNKLAAANDSSILANAPSKTIELGEGSRKLFDEFSQISKAYSFVSVFVLDCLGHLPSEFRSFAADILLSGMQFLTTNAVAVLLNECRTLRDRIMLHDIGLSLGIMEWIKDYKKFISEGAVDMFESFGNQGRGSECYTTPELDEGIPVVSRAMLSANGESQENRKSQVQILNLPLTTFSEIYAQNSSSELRHTSMPLENKESQIQDATILIKQIRREEFGLDLNTTDNDLLKKQHARLGRALNCLSQELYSQDSHIVLELIQNADDNSYPENVEPTLVFILKDNGVIVLNNELGFSAQNMRALCDVGSSTKKGACGGYIGQKGIGFKSVFRVTDAPEIHSNGFHVKFDITDGQIGFVLPTIIEPCDIDIFKRQVICESDQSDATSWNTCIVLPFKSELKMAKGMSPILSMFSDIHPHLLLFLQRLRCIRYKNMISNELIIMRRESNKNGIVTVSLGRDKMSWLLVSRNLQPTSVRPDVQTTKITLAFPLEESENAIYKARLDPQNVFAFLPLRKYGLNFILQADFILPSSREEVDGNSAWNQWLLSRTPDLFVSAEKSFSALPCFQENQGKAVTAFMSFVPLMGEVYGFFSDLPRMIIKELRKSNCLLLDGPNMKWVPPYRVLRNCDDQVHNFLPQNLLQKYLGLGYLHRDIVLRDSLARELGIQEYGPEFLIELQSSIYHSNGSGLLDLEWLSCWLNALCVSFSVNPSKYLASANVMMESNLIRKLKEIPFIPLSDGLHVSVTEGPVWLPYDISTLKHEAGNVLKNLPGLYSKLRTITPLLFCTEFVAKSNNIEENRVENIIRVLLKIGVRQLSSHDVVKNHIMPSISHGSISGTSTDLMIQYLFCIMMHLQSACSSCHIEREVIITELQRQSVIYTNHGYMCPAEKPIHFSKEFGNPFDMNKLMGNVEVEWIELDNIYLQHPSIQSLSDGLNKWRDFFMELGVTDFVQVRHVEISAKDVLCIAPKNMPVNEDVRNGDTIIEDWESPELVNLLSVLSTQKCLDKCKYLLEIFDKMWDDCYSLKSKCVNPIQCGEQMKTFESSFVKCIRRFKWIVSSLDDELHYPEDVFYDCEVVHSIMGSAAPYTVPKVTSRRFAEDVGLKVQFTLEDALRVLQSWRNSKFSASIFQMTKLYTFIRDELVKSKGSISEVKSNIFIFIPSVCRVNTMDIVPGTFMLPDKLYWHDPSGCVGRIREITHSHDTTSETEVPACTTLSVLYPGLYDFLVADCSVFEAPSLCRYLVILRHLSNVALPSQVAHEVFQVFLKWADDFKSEFVCCDEINDFRDKLLESENTVLPTVQDKWVSLNPSYGVICWTDDEKIIEQFMDLNDVHILQFGELTSSEREMLCGKVAIFMQKIGISALPEVVSREAIHYGIADSSFVASLINWITPYAQRYLYKMHPDRYCHLKEFVFAKTFQLQVFVVEKLYYKNSIKGRGIPTQKWFECNCILERNIFYATPDTDSHALFLELSRFFFHGIPNLQIANFLHIITNKAELGHTEEQIEPFIVDSCNVPRLPEGEPLWPLAVLSEHNFVGHTPHMRTKQQFMNSTIKQSSKLSWPLANWTATADMHSASNIHLSKFSEPSSAESSENALMQLPEAINVEDVPVPSMVDDVFLSVFQSARSDSNDMLCLETLTNDEPCKAGRLGEMIAYRYFREKLCEEAVIWVNEDSETGLPYDLIIEQESNRLYVEVKSTTSPTKNWFALSTNEWQCATEKEDAFIIARVILSNQKKAKILIFRNPVKLCRKNVLQLAIIQPANSDNSTA